MSNLLSRVEGILENKVYGTPYDEPPQSRIEDLLTKLNTGGGGGGNGEVNRINSIKVNGKTQTIGSDKSVNIEVPTKTSELDNDSHFIDEVDTELNDESTNPVENGIVTKAIRNPAQGVNLILDSKVEISGRSDSSSGWITIFNLSEMIELGRTYTLTIFGNLPNDNAYFDFHIGKASDNGWNNFASKTSKIMKIGEGVYSTNGMIDSWSNGNDQKDKNRLNLYVKPNDIVTDFTINAIKFEHGIVENPIWTPAPEDSLELMNDVANLEKTVSWLDKRAVVGQSGASTTKPWYKFASLNASINSDFRISFKVASVYGTRNVYLGILTANVRRSSDEIVSTKLIWEYASSNIDLNDVVLTYRDKKSTDVELWCKIDQSYEGWIFEVLDEGSTNNHSNNLWTLYQNRSAGYADEPTPGYTQVPSTLMTLANPVESANYLLTQLNENFEGKTIADLRTNLENAQTKAKQSSYIAVEVAMSSNWINYWNAEDLNSKILVGNRWTFHLLQSYDTKSYSSWLVSTYIEDYHFIITKTAGKWSKVKKIALEPNVLTPANYYSQLDMFIPVEQRRNTFRGRNLGSVYTDAQKAAVAAGTFDDLFIGDYWVINGVTWRIVDINYWLNTGDTPCTTPHLVIMPDSQLYTGKMNSENTTQGGYGGSEMYKYGLHDAKTTINNAFGSDYILSHREYLTNAVTDGHPSGAAWVDSKVELPNEPMMYGSYIFTAAGDGTFVPNRHTIDKTQLALMKMYPRFINPNRQAQWLRDVVSADEFAHVSTASNAYSAIVSNDIGVRVVFGLKGAAS